MECFPRELKTYETIDGRQPFWEWIQSLKDKKTRSRILRRLDKVRLGNLGDCAHIGNGVFELREHHGPGYRIYFGEEEKNIVILLCGGEKDFQQDDIQRAKDYWEDYRRRPDA